MADDRGAGGGRLSEAVAESTSRRGFLARVGRLMAGATLAGVATDAAVRAERADGHHFCGHIADTGSCPHPTGIPRVDPRGYPLRAKDGVPVDDLGRPVDDRGRPVDRAGRPLRDVRGRPLAPAPRSHICLDAVPARYRIPVRVDGAWFRCCGGRVRKLIDCCSTHPRRINGDRAVRGYCYRKRTVYCVYYLDTKVPC
ncbi:MAG: hypothetical protein RIB67_04710 [Miltoncostaeaceae bacterium]